MTTYSKIVIGILLIFAFFIPGQSWADNVIKRNFKKVDSNSATVRIEIVREDPNMRDKVGSLQGLTFVDDVDIQSKKKRDIMKFIKMLEDDPKSRLAKLKQEILELNCEEAHLPVEQRDPMCPKVIVTDVLTTESQRSGMDYGSGKVSFIVGLAFPGSAVRYLATHLVDVKVVVEGESSQDGKFVKTMEVDDIQQIASPAPVD